MNQSQSSSITQTSASFAGTKSEAKEVKQKLAKAIGDSHDVLVRASTVFPRTLFPDTLTVDRTKLTVTHRNFLNAGEVLSIRIEDILNVTAQVGPIFGSIKISTRFFDNKKPYEVDHFWRGDALKIKRIVQGYLIAKQQKVDCSKLSTPELAKLLDELGQVDKPDKV
jgi:hypothetical protein